MESRICSLACAVHRYGLTIDSRGTSKTMLMLTPITITIALMCFAFMVALAYVAIDEQA